MAEYARFALGRVGSAVLTLLGISVIIFVAIQLLPGSYDEIFFSRLSPEGRAQIAAKLGLDRHPVEQYFRWFWAALNGDLGISFITRQPVSIEFASRIPVTGELAVLATVVSLVIGVPLGIVSGLASRRRFVQGASRFTGAAAMSVPDFVLGSIFLYLFTKFPLGLTVGQWVPISEDIVGNLRAAALPVVTLAVLGIGLVLATTRHTVIGILAQDFITAAVARGQAPRLIVLHHVLRNAAIPLVTIVAIYSGYLLGGTIIVEMIYSIPGLGRYLIQGVLNRDYPVVQAGVLIGAGFFVILNMLADLSYGALDPRLRVRRAR